VHEHRRRLPYLYAAYRRRPPRMGVVVVAPFAAVKTAKVSPFPFQAA
jgi:hypothetical protein